MKIPPLAVVGGGIYYFSKYNPNCFLYKQPYASYNEYIAEYFE